jgi:hypothetical protein
MTTIEVPAVNDSILRGCSVKKNAFRRIAKGAYPKRFVRQVGKNIEEILNGDIETASMVREDERSGCYRFRIGLGGKNEYVANDYHPKDDYLEYATLKELSEALHQVLAMAKQGDFNDALEDLRERRQDRADIMIAAQTRNKGVFGTLEEAA